MTTDVDLLVVGGGINGAGVARDAAGRGLKVMLVEQNDLASATSSASTKLIHGGLRYLEHGAVGLVRKSLKERARLMRLAPHLIRPMRFVLPHDASLRPAWMIRIGLLLYDTLAGRGGLPGSAGIDLAAAPEGAGLDARFKRGFLYSDAWVDDARLVVANAIDAAERGARVATRTKMVGAERGPDHWTIDLETETGRETVTTRVLVNAAGPWADDVLARAGKPSNRPLRLVKGSHIVLPRLFEGDHAYLFQNDDRRVVFAIPYEGRFTLIGTTDETYVGDPGAVAISDAEIDYLLTLANTRMDVSVAREDVVWSFAGVRPLVDDGSADPSAVTRDYDLAFDEEAAPLLSLLGGKLTTYRQLAEEAVDILAARVFGLGAAWTGDAALPGGDMPGGDFDTFLAAETALRTWLAPDTVERLARAYGARMDALLGGAESLADLGRDFGAGLTQREVDWLIDKEWAHAGEDVVWRRTKLGLALSPAERADVAAYVAAAVKK